MSHDYLARKIQITKFEATSYTRGYWDIRADSITGRDLQTQKECLSVWRCSNIREDVAEIALALATTLYDIEGVSIILLNKSDMECLGFKFNDVEGETLVKDLNKRHTDIIELDALKSVRLALGITIGVRDNGCYQFTTAEIK